MKRIVIKFGGTSVSSIQKIIDAAKILGMQYILPLLNCK